MGSSISPSEAKAYLYLWVQGLLKGYSPSNITWLCQQVRLETGGWSNGLIRDRNPFGLGCAQIRPNNQVGCSSNGDVGIGVYSSIWAAVSDRFAWDMYWGFDAKRKSGGYPETVASKYHLSADYANSVGSISLRYMRGGLIQAMLVGGLGLYISSKIIQW